MNCSYCDSEAAFICFCSKVPLCPIHLGHHIIINGNHPFEPLNCFLKDEKIPIFKSNILKNIELAIEAQSQITKQTTKYIKQIENLQKECMKNLNEKIEFYTNLLAMSKFCKSEVSVVEDIFYVKLVPNEFKDIEVSEEVKGFFKQVLLIDQEELSITVLGKRSKLITESLITDAIYRAAIFAKTCDLEEAARCVSGIFQGGVQFPIFYKTLISPDVPFIFEKIKMLTLGHHLGVKLVVDKITGPSEFVSWKPNKKTLNRIWSTHKDLVPKELWQELFPYKFDHFEHAYLRSEGVFVPFSKPRKNLGDPRHREKTEFKAYPIGRYGRSRLVRNASRFWSDSRKFMDDRSEDSIKIKNEVLVRGFRGRYNRSRLVRNASRFWSDSRKFIDERSEDSIKIKYKVSVRGSIVADVPVVEQVADAPVVKFLSIDLERV